MLRHMVSIALVLLIGGIAEAQVASSGSLPATSSKDAAARKKELDIRLAKLNQRVTLRAAVRKALVTDCMTCGGEGHKVVGQQGGLKKAAVRCVACSGTGNQYSRNYVDKATHDFYSPAGRLSEAAKAYREEFETFTVADATRLSIKSYRQDKKAVLVDDTHAHVFGVEDGDVLPEPEAWVHAPDDTGSPQWFLWTDKDGPWPTGEVDESAAEPEDESAIEPEDESAAEVEEPAAPERVELAGEQRKGVEEILAKAGATCRVKGLAQAGEVLVITLGLPDDGEESGIPSLVQADSVACVRAAMTEVASEWDVMRLEFTATYKNRFGTVEPQPVWIVSMSAEDYRQITWENLDATERWELFDSEEPDHEGWKRFTPPAGDAGG